MAGKFADFIKQNGIDPRRVVNASRQIEKLRPEDRALRLAQRNKDADAPEETKAGKPRSGKPVTQRLLAAASQGKSVSGPAKTRLLRAINRVLEQKKKAPVELRALF
jgi:hypothetical protein